MSEEVTLAPIPFSTSTPPVPGTFKVEFEDFRVTELHDREAEGEGDHVWLDIEKTDLSTVEAAKRIGRALELDRRSISWAGMKDRRGITQQRLCLQNTKLEALDGLKVEGLRVLDAKAHPRKLRVGQLAGNAFEILIRCDAAAAEAPVREALDSLLKNGVPNFFDKQRFGRDNRNWSRARAWLVDGGRPPRSKVDKRMLGSVLQSAVFNEVLRMRVEAESVGTVLSGEVLKREDSGGVFTSEDLVDEQARVDRLELHPAGPMPGPKCMKASEEALALETRAMERLGVCVEHFDHGKLMPGTRRPMRFCIQDAALEATEDGLRLSMRLPSGCYATQVLRELFKEGLEEFRPPRPPREA